jgi:thiol-disulfide isomerase/thioredoxin
MSTASTSSDSTHENDWRIHLLGTHILINQRERDDEEALEEPELVPIKEILSPKTYDYIAVFIGADYCPHCKAFAPTVKQSVKYFEEKKTKVLFLSNDRTDEAFKASCKKNTGIDVIPYDLDKTRGLRDLFDLKTIPALMILKNSNFTHKTPTVVTNARNTLVADPECKSFPWVSEGPMSAWDRLFIHGKYGKVSHFKPVFFVQIFAQHPRRHSFIV